MSSPFIYIYVYEIEKTQENGNCVLDSEVLKCVHLSNNILLHISLSENYKLIVFTFSLKKVEVL